MKLKLSLLALLFAGLTFTACQKDELERVAPEAPAIEDVDIHEGRVGRIPLVTLTPSPCGYGFSCQLQHTNGTTAPGSWPYDIEDSNGTTVDSGSITNGNNTNWVLSPCTSYTINFYGNYLSIISGIPTQSITITSDGCGNNYNC